MSESSASGVPEYPPAAYAAAVPADLTTAPPASLARWFLLTAVAGVLLGILWWLLAPSGAFYGAGANYNIWLPRDLTLGGLCALGGVVTAAVLLPQRRKRGSAAKAAAAIVGSFAGSLIAWQVGCFAGSIFQHVPANVGSASVAFSLRSASILLIWPTICALVIFAATLVSLIMASPSREQ